MTATPNRAPFWVDDDYDRDSASDGESRYGVYLQMNAKMFEDHWDSRNKLASDPGDFAIAAWRVANSPIMAPGYVCHVPRILSATLETNDWDGTLLATVTLVAPTPAVLRQVVIGYNEWARSPGSWDSPEREYYEPDGKDLARRPTILPSIRVLLPIAGDILPRPASAPAGLLTTADAKASVAALVAELNKQVQPVLDALESE